MFKRSKEPEKKGSEKREDLLVSFLKDAHFVFAIILVLVFLIDTVRLNVNKQIESDLLYEIQIKD